VGLPYNNPIIPTCDDTAVVVMAMDRSGRPTQGDEYACRDRGAAASGLWACKAATVAGPAFDANNLEYYLNNIPFSDTGALLDPPTEDVTGRCRLWLAHS